VAEPPSRRHRPVEGGGGAGGGAGPRGGGGAAAVDAPPAIVDAAGDAPNADSGAAADGPARGVTDGPILGGDMRFRPGAPCAADCLEQSRQYAEALLRGQKCVPGAPGQCTSRAIGGPLVCGGRCVFWVQETGEIAAVLARHDRECAGCTFHQTPGRCHPTICNQLEIPVCKALPSGEGTCVNMERDRPCPPEAMYGAPCDRSKYDTCTNGPGGASCACAGSGQWFCFPPAGA